MCFIVKILLIGQLLALSNALQCDGINEEFLECGKKCEKTCENFMKSKSCSAECVSGCFCVPGTVRNHFYQCVQISDCPFEGFKHVDMEVKRCPKPHTEFSICGSACPDTCDNPYASRTCNPGCVRGCFCEQGYVKNKHGDCIKREKCLNREEFPDCPDPLEEFDPCGSPCPLTCDNYGVDLDCKKKCVPGCYCKQGLVRDGDGNCILPAMCDTTEYDFGMNKEYAQLNITEVCPGANQVFKIAGASQVTCLSASQPMKPYTAKLALGCFCKPGFVRNIFGDCIPPEECPKFQCPGRHEVFLCGPACDLSCFELEKPCTKFSRTCVHQCYCMPGYARDYKNRCVPISKCPLRCRYFSPFVVPFVWHPDFITHYSKPTVPENPEIQPVD